MPHVDSTVPAVLDAVGRGCCPELNGQLLGLPGDLIFLLVLLSYSYVMPRPIHAFKKKRCSLQGPLRYFCALQFALSPRSSLFIALWLAYSCGLPGFHNKIMGNPLRGIPAVMFA
ncbi:hypothetical protein FB451DRAFT_1408178 [Mycena latifolia]|nr:hypothetical protein FB451DRAFT_1408178 [Mycena latifolia]